MLSPLMARVVPFTVLLIGWIFQAHALETGAPDTLKTWESWVGYSNPDYLCPFLSSGTQRICNAPAKLTLKLTTIGGRFELEGQTYQDGWVTLPGGVGAWPQAVKVNAKRQAVGDSGGKPAVRLKPGAYKILGDFVWKRLPEQLNVPAEVALVDLKVNGKSYSTINRPQQDSIWLGKQRQAAVKDQQDSFSVKVYRKILDGVPMVVSTLYRIEVSGTQRDVSVPVPLLSGFLPVRVTSSLPVRMDDDGQFVVQVRPGRWDLEVNARSESDITELKVPDFGDVPGWPVEEIWVYQARPEIRLVELSGFTSIDPGQVSLPRAWKQLPTYRARPGETLSFTVKRRGNPEPEGNQLSLSRHLWLDFDGEGYTARDQITGTVSQGWRISAYPGTELGYLAADSEPQWITRLPEEPSPGVEIRQGRVNLVGESRIKRGEVLSATGWNETFQKVLVDVHIPPGWSVFSVSGTDNVPNTWLQSWTLFDVFLVLVLSVGSARLWGWSWGTLVLIGLVVMWHEPGAPRWVWMNLLVASALVRVISGYPKIQKFIESYRALSALALVFVLLPFAVDQVRIAFYPQLERPYQSIQSGTSQIGSSYPGSKSVQVTEGRLRALEEDMLMAEAQPEKQGFDRRQYNYPINNESLKIVDPNAKLNTGPGLPQWSWSLLRLTWSGPVQPGQTLNIHYISPAVGSLINVLSVVMGLLLAWRFTRDMLDKALARAVPAAAAVIVLPLLAATMIPDNAMADYPPESFLNELKSRMLAPPQCMPGCAEIPIASVSIKDDSLQLRMEVQAIERVVVPLPGQMGQWLPQVVLIDDTLPPLYRDGAGGLHIALDPGVHRLVMTGSLSGMNSALLHFPLTPKYLEDHADGWDIKGFRLPGVPGPQLELVRINPDIESEEPWEAVSLPAFVRLNRQLNLGLEWRVTNTITRVSPSEGSIALEIPLLPGEFVLSEHVTAKDDKLVVTLGPKQQSASWASRLDIVSNLALKAAISPDWVEQWQFAVAPIWHVEYEGIPPIHHTDREAQWLPTWQPWPGELLVASISRPEGVSGRTETIQSSVLTIKPGQRATDAELTLDIRSSQGSQHTITLPDQAELQTVTINGQAQPIRQEGRNVTLPLKPGSQNISLTWRTPSAVDMKTYSSTVDLGLPHVNASTSIQMGYDRWILWLSGPDMGPAVLFWGVLVVIMVVAIVLGRTGKTPLRAWEWILLGLGLSQIPVILGALVVAWFFMLHYRGVMDPIQERWKFNLNQFAIVLMTFIAMSALFMAVQKGLLGWPAMMVSGNQSSAYQFNWYQDRSAEGMYPQAMVISVPVMAYRVLMLLWALWLAFSSIRWLKWGWAQFSKDGIFRPVELRNRGKVPQTSDAPSSDVSDVPAIPDDKPKE